MHEISLVSAMMDLIKRDYGAKPIKVIRLRVGILSCVEPSALESCFSVLKQQDKLFKSCNVSILVTYPNAHCSHCKRHFSITQIGQPCRCGTYDYAVSGGDDLTIQDLEFI